MSKFAVYLLELLGVGGMVMLMAYISWTKLAFGGVLTVIGAFFPNLAAKKETGGNAEIKIWNTLVKWSGGLRFGVIVAGLIVLLGAILEGQQGYSADADKRAAQKLSEAKKKAAEFEQLRQQIQKRRQEKKLSEVDTKKILDELLELQTTDSEENLKENGSPGR